jgi:hypothetical protein
MEQVAGSSCHLEILFTSCELPSSLMETCKFPVCVSPSSQLLFPFIDCPLSFPSGLLSLESPFTSLFLWLSFRCGILSISSGSGSQGLIFVSPTVSLLHEKMRDCKVNLQTLSSKWIIVETEEENHFPSHKSLVVDKQQLVVVLE